MATEDSATYQKRGGRDLLWGTVFLLCAAVGLVLTILWASEWWHWLSGLVATLVLLGVGVVYVRRGREARGR
ncbi:MAG: hypothetical protein R2737_14035 [Candidatus Nanopelagicales bacterium]